jgi:hypothetical protein
MTPDGYRNPLAKAAIEVLRATDRLTDAINGSGHPGEAHDHVLGDLLSPHRVCDQIADCAACGGAQYGCEDDLHRALGSLRMALGQEPKNWEYPDR